jgi:hypothetical protein
MNFPPRSQESTACGQAPATSAGALTGMRLYALLLGLILTGAVVPGA